MLMSTTVKAVRAALPTETRGLIQFFEQRSLKQGDETHLASLVQDLGKGVYLRREQAARQLELRGPAERTGAYFRAGTQIGELGSDKGVARIFADGDRGDLQTFGKIRGEIFEAVDGDVVAEDSHDFRIRDGR